MALDGPPSFLPVQPLMVNANNYLNATADIPYGSEMPHWDAIGLEATLCLPIGISALAMERVA